MESFTKRILRSPRGSGLHRDSRHVTDGVHEIGDDRLELGGASGVAHIGARVLGRRLEQEERITDRLPGIETDEDLVIAETPLVCQPAGFVGALSVATAAVRRRSTRPTPLEASSTPPTLSVVFRHVTERYPVGIRARLHSATRRMPPHDDRPPAAR